MSLTVEQLVRRVNSAVTECGGVRKLDVTAQWRCTEDNGRHSLLSGGVRKTMDHGRHSLLSGGVRKTMGVTAQRRDLLTLPDLFARFVAYNMLLVT